MAEQKTKYVVRLVSTNRGVDEEVLTKPLTISEMDYILSTLSNECAVSIPRVRHLTVKSQGGEVVYDTFAVMGSLARDLDFVEYGIYEGQEGV